MTAIAAFRFHNVPIIIGDLLVSTEEAVEQTIRLPGSGQRSSEVTGFAHAVGLKQKVNVITGSLIVAWSGPEIVARSFVKELKAAMSLMSSPTWEDVKGLLDKLDDENLTTKLGAESAFIFLYKEGPRTIIGRSKNAQEERVEGYPGLVFAGSGSAALIESLKGFTTTYSTNQINTGTQAVHNFISIVARLWRLDITSQASIRSGFGGGYEIGTILPDGRLGKVGDILLAAVEVNRTGELGQNRRLAKLDYLDDYLIIRVLDLQGDPPTHKEGRDTVATIEKIDRRNFIITPIDVDDRSLKIEELGLDRLLDWNAEYTAVHLDVIAENGKRLEATLSYWRQQRDGPIRFEDGEIYWTPEIVGELVAMASEFRSSNSDSENAE